MKKLGILLLCISVLVILGCMPQNQQMTKPNSSEVSTESETEESVCNETVVTIPTEKESLPPIDPIDQILDQMTIEQKVGQLFLVACPDTDAVEQIRQYQFGGIVLFGKDLAGQTPETLRKFLHEIQMASTIPILIAVDEEGGSVCRVSSQSAFRNHRFQSPGNILEAGGLELLKQTEMEKCQLLKKLGINVNLAPVCDIATEPEAFMYSRSLRQKPLDTAESVAAIVNIMNKMCIGSVLKHFPGYGNNVDTHYSEAIDERPLEKLEKEDLLPFQAGIDSGANAILVSHTVVAALDDKMPASLSLPVHMYLREKMQFNGVVITDDLKMAAISEAFGDEEAAVLAVIAGNDMLCLWEYKMQYKAVVEAVRTGRISMEKMNDSIRRILSWKQQLGILEF